VRLRQREPPDAAALGDEAVRQIVRAHRVHADDVSVVVDGERSRRECAGEADLLVRAVPADEAFDASVLIRADDGSRIVDSLRQRRRRSRHRDEIEGPAIVDPALDQDLSGAGDVDRGLLGVAFHPSFPATPHVFLYYTVPGTPAHNRISRFTANGDTAVAGSEVILVDLDNLSGATNHNGGAIHFGPDGKLFAGVGENANGANAQTFAKS